MKTDCQECETRLLCVRDGDLRPIPALACWYLAFYFYFTNPLLDSCPLQGAFAAASFLIQELSFTDFANSDLRKF